MKAKHVLVTGATGYIGGWVVKYLLEDGNKVNITVRDKSKVDKYAHLQKIADNSSGELAIFEADLLKEGSFLEPMQNCEVVFHVASPFVINNIKDPQKQLVDPALKGTKNVLNAVNQTDSVKRVVLTSSVVAVYGDSKEMSDLGIEKYNESYWNTTSNLKHQPYSYSKVLAEKEASIISEQQDRWSLSVINPGFVMGPSLNGPTSSGSYDFIGDYISGKQKMGVPLLYFGYVDVRDVAKAHILAADKNSDGRHLTVNKSYTMMEVANMIRAKYGKQFALPAMEMPKFLIYLFGWTQGITLKYISRNIGYPLYFDNTKTKEVLGMEYRPIEKAIEEMVEQLKK